MTVTLTQISSSHHLRFPGRAQQDVLKQTESVTDTLRRTRQVMHEEIGRTAETLATLRTVHFVL